MTDTNIPITDGCGHISHHTRTLPIDSSRIGKVAFTNPEKAFLDDWSLELSETSDAKYLQEAALELRSNDTPVAFPTETVYGLGADATRSTAVTGIYEAKRRPADNPLIVHVSSIAQLTKLLRHGTATTDCNQALSDPIPSVYRALIDRFWPGPLTLVLPLPSPSPLASQVTAGLSTFAVRMPSSFLALALIHLADVPLAAPSANASTRPSPTTAAHVMQDLSGRIKTIIDGGECEVGLESTVVDGLTDPPVILRPGGISAEMLRQSPGWEKVAVGYKDSPENGIPKVPGMKYKHYSPRAKVILIKRALDAQLLAKHSSSTDNIGCVATRTWGNAPFNHLRGVTALEYENNSKTNNGCSYLPQAKAERAAFDPAYTLPSARLTFSAGKFTQILVEGRPRDKPLSVWTVPLGSEVPQIARGLFSALRELDGKGVDVILVEGIGDDEGGAAAAVMNRLRKAADQLET